MKNIDIDTSYSEIVSYLKKAQKKKLPKDLLNTYSKLIHGKYIDKLNL
jgi:hypothetical protein